MAKEGGILDRLGDIIQSNIHAALDKCENPEKMLDQNMRKALDDLADLKQAAVELAADETAAKRNYDAAAARMQAEHNYAVNAMKAGDEAAAQKFLESEARIRTAEVEPAKRNYDAAVANYAKVKEAYNKLAADIDFMRNQMNTIKGTMKTAKATEKVARMQDTRSTASDNFTKYADKAQRMLDEANAKIEMNTAPVDEMASLREKYAGTAAPDMSDAMAALRKEAGLGGTE